MFRQHYHLEFVLDIRETNLESIKNSLKGLIDTMDISPLLENKHGEGKNFKIQVKTKEPELVFDVCSQFGRLKSVRISEGS